MTKREHAEQRSMWYPFGMVGAWSIIGTVVVFVGVLQVLSLPQGSGFPIDPGFWRPVIPFALIAIAAFGVSRLGPFGSVWRDVFLSGSIAVGAGSLSFLLLLFATGERLGWEDVVQATPVDPANAYTCTRNAEGGMDCLNHLGEAAPGYSYTVIEQRN